MDWNQVIEQMGGGLSAVVIAAMGFAVWRLSWKATTPGSRASGNMRAS